MKRIEGMIWGKRELTQEEFTYAERFLKDGCLNPALKNRCLTMLGNLCNQRAVLYREKAVQIAKLALESEPESHENHAILCEGMGGVFMDWCITNHVRIIDFYKEYTRKHPNDRAGYMWLIDNLVADGRFEEAKEANETMRNIKETYHYYMYKAYIAQYEIGWDAAVPYLEEMIVKFSDHEHAWNERASFYAKRGQYRQAISDFKKAAELEPAPRYIDNFLSIAQLFELLGDKEEAIAAYEKVIEISREDWGITEGQAIQEYYEKINQLKR